MRWAVAERVGRKLQPCNLAGPEPRNGRPPERPATSAVPTASGHIVVQVRLQPGALKLLRTRAAERGLPKAACEVDAQVALFGVLETLAWRASGFDWLRRQGMVAKVILAGADAGAMASLYKPPRPNGAPELLG